MKIPGREYVEKIRRQYPIGTRLVLDAMSDTQAPEPGTQATVTYVDDMGDIGCAWDSGGSLKLIVGEDSFHKVHTEEEAENTLKYIASGQKDGDYCPRCGAVMPGKLASHARSRRLNITVCDACGNTEAIEDYAVASMGREKSSLLDWAAFRTDWEGWK